MSDTAWSSPRRLGVADAPAVSALESRCFPHAAWSTEQYARALGEDRFFAAYGCDGPDGLAGYVAYYHTDGELEIVNVAVDPALRGQGCATALLRKVLHGPGEGSIKKCCLEVRRSNVPALRLYASAGFVEAGVRKRYYADTGEDALVMVLSREA